MTHDRDRTWWPRVSGSGPLFERDREVEALDRLVRGALAGEAVLALVEGPAGIGKSRLLGEAHELARAAGFRMLTARGSGLEQELPYGIVRQLFESLLLEPSRREHWLRGSAGAATRVFAPPEDEGHAAGPGSFAMLHALFWLTANVAADGPLGLVIDDLQWCDRASLRFIAYLERRLEGLQVLIVTAARMEDAGSESRLVLDIIQDPVAVPIRLSALSEGGAAELVHDRLGEAAEPAFCAACHHATDGNPLLLGELVKTLQAERVRPDAAHADMIRKIGPRAVSRTVLIRLSRLSSDAVAVAQAVALLGDGASLPATAALAGLDEARVAQATPTLVAAEILRDESPLGFVHALVRDAVYLELSLFERQLRHQRAAEKLAALGAAPEVVASQLLLVPSRGDSWVAQVLRKAGLLAMRRGDAESAVSYLRRALEEGADEDRLGLLWELGSAEARIDSEASAERLREVQDRLDDPLQRALVADVLARSLLWTRPAHEAVTVAQHAIVELQGTHVDQRRALEAIELYAVYFGGARVPDWKVRLARVRADGVPERLGAKMLAAVAAWGWALGGGSARECSAFALAVLADGALIAGDPGFGAAAAGAVLALADHDEALRVWEEAMSASRRLGSAPYVCSVNLWRGWTWLQRGELAEAEASLREANEQLRRGFGSNGPSLAYGAAFLARTLIERGDLSGARRALADRGRPNPQSDGDWMVHRAGVELLLAEGRWNESLTAGAAHGPPARGADNPAWAPWRSLTARALDGLGRHDEADALLIAELDVARRWGAPGALAPTLTLLGTLRQGNGHELLREAVAVTEASPARLEHAKALTALGSAIRRSGRRADSREPLAHGLEIALRCGAVALAETARTELYAAGGRPRREALSGPASLTPSERRIADLAAQGQTTRGIAQSLYVTPRTVEGHLTNIYRKLGVSTRTALPGALAGHSSA